MRPPPTNLSGAQSYQSPGRRVPKTRGTYTSHACLECQRRKRKCTGGRECTNCRFANTECLYAGRRGSKQRCATPRSSSSSPPSAQYLLNSLLCQGNAPDVTEPIENISSVLLARLQRLPEGCEGLSRQLASLRRESDQQKPVAQKSPISAEVPYTLADCTPESASSSKTSQNVFQHNTSFIDSTAASSQIDRLNRAVAQNISTAALSTRLNAEAGEEGVGEEGVGEEGVGEEDTGEEGAGNLDLLRTIDRVVMDQVVQQTRLDDADKTLHYFDLYFEYVNPYYPCINEAYLRTQFAAFLANDSPYSMCQDAASQFATLLNLMVANVRILHDPCKPGDPVPGWKEFCRAERLLSYSAWLEKANLTTIQILLLKASYYRHTSKHNAAYDTVGTSLRLCLQLGLHNEPSWGSGIGFYERAYRQRTFWSTYCMNHQVAQNSGVPELIREADFEVEYPKCVDDKMLYPNCPPLQEVPKRSPIPFLIEVIKWAKLCSNIWEVMFGVKAKRPVNQEFILTTEQKILEWAKEIPDFLNWPYASESSASETIPTSVRQHGFILYLRIRAVRLLLRCEDMMTLRCKEGVMQGSIAIATEVMNAVETANSSGMLGTNTRQAFVLHLTRVMVHMICVVLHQKSDSGLVQPAVNLLDRSHVILKAIARDYSLARRTLHQLRRPIRAAQYVIRTNWPQFAAPSTTLDMSTSITPPQDFDIFMDNGHVGSSIPFHEGLVMGPQGGFEGSWMWEDIGLWTTMDSI
jgi:hypothetical protein